MEKHLQNQPLEHWNDSRQTLFLNVMKLESFKINET